MKKLAALIILLCLSLSACGNGEANQKTEVKVDLGSSSLYSEQERKDAVEVLQKEFSSFKGCVLQSITYGGDEKSKSADRGADYGEKIKKKQDASGVIYVDSILFLLDFRTTQDAEGAWGKNQEYKAMLFWLARPKGGPWEYITSGY